MNILTEDLSSKTRFTRIVIFAAALHLLLLLLFEISFNLTSKNKVKEHELDVTLNLMTIPAAETKLIGHPNSSTGHPEFLGQPSSTTKNLPPLSKRTISAAAHESKDAAYLARWQQYVEDFGNEHYPVIAQKNKLFGELRLLVAVNKDGSLHEVSIRQSSGNALLDEAAILLVKQAAPFEPLPQEVAEGIEVLEIIRTWQFRGKLYTKQS